MNIETRLVKVSAALSSVSVRGGARIVAQELRDAGFIATEWQRSAVDGVTVSVGKNESAANRKRREALLKDLDARGFAGVLVVVITSEADSRLMPPPPKGPKGKARATTSPTPSTERHSKVRGSSAAPSRNVDPSSTLTPARRK